MHGIGNGSVITEGKENGIVLGPDTVIPNGIPTELENKLQSNLFPEKFDQFQAKIGHEMDIRIPPKYDRADDETGTPKYMNGYINGGYTVNEDDEMAAQHHKYDEDDDVYSPDPQHEEIYYYPVEEVIVEDCCPAVIYRTFPCCVGDDNSPFWEAWNRHRLLGSR